MYPVPPRPETQGLTETYVGNWLAKRGNREKLVIASKVSGPARNSDAGIRPNQILDRKNIRAALDASLKRLQTDYLDLYQYTGRSVQPTALVSSATAGTKALPPLRCLKRWKR